MLLLLPHASCLDASTTALAIWADFSGLLEANRTLTSNVLRRRLTVRPSATAARVCAAGDDFRNTLFEKCGQAVRFELRVPAQPKCTDNVVEDRRRPHHLNLALYSLMLSVWPRGVEWSDRLLARIDLDNGARGVKVGHAIDSSGHANRRDDRQCRDPLMRL
jgi:hypothetical protein